MYKVLLSDQGHDLDYNRMRLYFIDAATWATRNCTSFKHFEIVDVVDVSPVCDQMAEYEFLDQGDATMFSLKFSR
jgi:hypothetical protein